MSAGSLQFVTEAAQFLFWEYINGIFVAVCMCIAVSEFAMQCIVASELMCVCLLHGASVIQLDRQLSGSPL